MEGMEILKNVGLSGQEILVYKTLLSFGPSTAGQMSEETNIHRTNVYSILIKLKNRGFISEYKEKTLSYFKVNDPKNILDFIKEAEQLVLDTLPELNQYYNRQAKPVDLEIFRGKEGVKAIFNHILREAEPVSGYGLTGKLRKILPIFAKQWIRQVLEEKIDVKYVYVEGVPKPWKSIKMKVLPKEYTSPVETQVYGDYVVILIWEPVQIAIRIHSSEIASSYKKYFGLIWEIAK